MAATCPNKSHEDWKYAVDKLGEEKTLFIYDKLGDLPSKEMVDAIFNPTLSTDSIVKPDVDYTSVTTRSDFDEKMDLLNKYNIKQHKSHYYYVLSGEEEEKLERYLSKSGGRAVLGKSKDGYTISNDIRGTVTYKIVKGRGYLFIDVKELQDDEGILLPKYVGSFKVPIDLIRGSDVPQYLKSRGNKSTYESRLEKDIKAYLFKTKGISVNRALSYYIVQLKTELIVMFNNLFNKEITYEELKDITPEQAQQIIESADFQKLMDRIKEDYRNKIDSIDYDEIKSNTLGRLSEIYTEEQLNDFEQLIDSLPENFLKIVFFDHTISEAAHFDHKLGERSTASVYDTRIANRKLSGIRSGLSRNIALRRLLDKGIINDSIIEKLNKKIRPGVQKYIEAIKKNSVEKRDEKRPISSSSYFNKNKALMDVLSEEQYLQYNVERAYIEEEIYKLMTGKFQGFTMLVEDLFSSNRNVNSVFTEILLGQFNDSKTPRRFTPDNVSIAAHEMGHAIDLYLATVNDKAREGIYYAITDLIKTVEFKDYLDKGLFSRGYDTSNKREIIADLFGYISLRAINYDVTKGHYDSLNDFFNNYKELINNIFNKYMPINKYEEFEEVVKTELRPVNIFISIINSIIKAINSFLGGDVFKELSEDVKTIETTLKGTKYNIGDVFDYLNKLTKDESIYDIDNIVDANLMNQSLWYALSIENNHTNKVTPESIINSIPDLPTVKHLEDILLGYRDAINSKRYQGALWVKQVSPDTPNYIAIVKDLVARVDDYYPGLIRMVYLEEQSRKVGRAIYKVVVDQEIFDKLKRNPDDSDYKQGLLFTKRIQESIEDMAQADESELEDFFVDNKDVSDSYSYLSKLLELNNISQEQKDIINIILNPNAVKPTIEVIHTTSSELNKYFTKEQIIRDSLDNSYGIYKNGKLYIIKDHILNSYSPKSMLIGTVIHEVIHGITMSTVIKYMSGAPTTAQEKEFVEKLSQLYYSAKKSSRLSSLPAYHTLEEFVADGLSDQRVIDELKVLKDTEKKSFWDKIKEFILKLLGVEYATGSYYHDLLSIFEDYYYNVRRAPSAIHNIQARKIADNIIKDEKNPTHKKIIKLLSDVEEAYSQQPKKFSGITTLMLQARLGGLPYEMLTPEEKANRDKNTGPGTDIHFHIQKSLKTTVNDIDLKYNLTDKAKEDLNRMLSKYQKPGVTILSEVRVVDWAQEITGIIDLVIIEADGKVHLYDFKTKKAGFADFNRAYNAKRGSQFFTPFSDYMKASMQLTAYSQMWEANTSTTVTSMNVIPLKSKVNEETKTIESVEIDRSFNNKDFINIGPMTWGWMEVLYNTRKKTPNKQENQDTFGSSEAEEALKERLSAKVKEIGQGASLTKEQEIFAKAIRSIQHRMEVSFRQNPGQRVFSKQLQFVNQILDKADKKSIDSAMLEVVRVAESMIYPTRDELQKLEEEGDSITPGILHRLKDTVIAFDFLDDYLMLLESRVDKSVKRNPKEAFKKQEKDIPMINRISELVRSKEYVKSKYEEIGIDILVDALYPYYNKIIVERKFELGKEYRRLKYEGKLTDPNITEKEYVDSKISLEGETLEQKTKFDIRKELKKASRDISTLAAWIDNLPDSPDPIVGAIVKQFVLLDDYARIETERYRLSALTKLDKCKDYLNKFGMNFIKAFEYALEKDLETGEYTGHIVSRFHSSLQAAEKNVMNGYEAIDNELERFLYKKAWLEDNMKRDDVQYYAAYSDYLDNLEKTKAITTKEYDVLRGQIVSNAPMQELYKSGLIREETYDKVSSWKRRNDRAFRNPSKQWQDPRWEELSKILKDENDPRTILYNLVRDMGEKGDSLVPVVMQIGTRLPGVTKQKNERIASGQGLFEVIKGSVSKTLDMKVDDTYRVQTEIVDSEGKARLFVPVHYSNPVRKTIKNADGEERQVFDPDEQSFNLPNIYFHYLASAIDFSWKNNLLPTMELEKHILLTREVRKLDTMGKIKMRYSKYFGDPNNPMNEVTIKGGNVAKQFIEWMDFALYGQTETSIGTLPGTNIDVNKAMHALQKFTALNFLGLNVMAGVANIILGGTMQFIEALAGQYVDLKSWRIAQGFYLKNTPGILGDIASTRPTNIVSLLLREFDVLHDEHIRNLTNPKWRELTQSDSLFFTNAMGEHKMQGTFLLAMLQQRRAFDKEGKDIGSMLDMYTRGEEEYVTKLKQKYGDNYGQHYEPALRYPDNFSEEKSDWSREPVEGKNGRGIFEIKTRRILTRIHGEYSKLGRVAIQANPFTSMAYMFRKFIVPGFRRRWGSRRYEEGIGEFVEGDYITAMAFVKNLYKNLITVKGLMLSKEWATLSDMEKANLIRFVGEVISLMSFFILISFFMGMRDDDDESDARMWNFLAYQALRLKSEMLFFVSPTEAMKILRSPAAGVSIIESTLKLGGQLFGPGWEVYQQGPWKDHLKIEKTLIDMTIGVKQYFKLRDVGEIVDLWKL